MSEMRILTVRQPWAWAIIHAGKDVENRVRNIAGSYRGPVAIHVARVVDESLLDYEHPQAGMIYAPCASGRALDHNSLTCAWCSKIEPRRWLDGGTIIGVVDLVDVHHSSHLGGCTDTNARSHMRRELCSPWAEADTTHLVFEHPRLLAEPIPYRGALGLRRLDEDTITKITAALAAERTT